MNLSQEEQNLIEERFRAIEVLLSPQKFATKVLKNARVVNVLTREIYRADIAINGKIILMIGDCNNLIGPETEVIDLNGKYVTPGFIDAHMHFESAMLTITEFTRISLPTGTTCLICDPHEIGNVLGPEGVRAMAAEAALMPHHVFLRIPALTPDSPGLETPGYHITSREVPEMLSYPSVSGIGEIQGVSAIKFVFAHNPDVIKDTLASTIYARSIGKGVDGNAPELFGPELAAHIIAGGTDVSCHETTTKAEAIEKLRYGVYLLMREGSTQRNMAECIKALTEEGFDSRRMILATDDMLAEDIVKSGHMNDIIRRTIRQGVGAVEAIQMATINPATWLGLNHLGVLAPGKLADLVVIAGELEDMEVEAVYLKGELVAKDGELLIDLPPYTYPATVKKSVKRDYVSAAELMLPARGTKVIVRCIGLIPDQNLSHAIEAEMKVDSGYILPPLDEDLLPIAVVGRYGQKDIGRSFVKGFGIKNGAFAESVSHDAHNIIVVGTNYNDMAVAVNHVIKMQGGVAVVKGGRVLGDLPLEIGGLMTDALTAHELITRMALLHRLAAEELGCKVHAPFMHLAFLSLTTSPKWKLTDKGVVDANNYCVLSSIKEVL